MNNVVINVRVSIYNLIWFHSPLFVILFLQIKFVVIYFFQKPFRKFSGASLVVENENLIQRTSRFQLQKIFVLLHNGAVNKPVLKSRLLSLHFALPETTQSGSFIY
jgi:hypothetical protein